MIILKLNYVFIEELTVWVNFAISWLKCYWNQSILNVKKVMQLTIEEFKSWKLSRVWDIYVEKLNSKDKRLQKGKRSPPFYK